MIRRIFLAVMAASLVTLTSLAEAQSPAAGEQSPQESWKVFERTLEQTDISETSPEQPSHQPDAARSGESSEGGAEKEDEQ